MDVVDLIGICHKACKQRTEARGNRCSLKAQFDLQFDLKNGI